MPSRPPRACPRPGCRHAQPCPDHAPARWSAGQPGRPMPPGWAATRLAVLDRDGHACRLRLPGCQGTATEAHHTRPGVEDPATIVAACPPCHRVVTQQQARAGRDG